MYARTALRNKFVDQGLDTASPTKVVTMLFERLCLDIERGKQALEVGNRSVCHDNLLHAQEIVVALIEGLDPAWELSAMSTELYQFLYKQLVAANLRGDVKLATECLDIAQPLRDTWVEAARLAAASTSGVVPSQQSA